MRATLPDDIEDLQRWAEHQGLSIAESKRRLAQSHLLAGIGSVATLRRMMVFKGGNALDMVWLPNRSTLDLDFNVDVTQEIDPLTKDSLEPLVSSAAEHATRLSAGLYQIHSIRQNPPGSESRFASLEVRVGYALSDEPKLIDRMLKLGASSNLIEMEISLNEPVCASTNVEIGSTSVFLRTATVEDIAAEKLRALLQQPVRNRNRRQDVLDLAHLFRRHPDIDFIRIALYLQIKCDARSVEYSRRAFQNPEVRIRAQRDYDSLIPTVRNAFIPFDEAFTEVLAFVARLPIPE